MGQEHAELTCPNSINFFSSGGSQLKFEVFTSSEVR